MREYNINIDRVGLKPTETAVIGHNQLKNLKVEDGFWSVPREITMPWESGQLLRGRDITLLVQEREGVIGISTIEELQMIGNDEEYPLDGYYVLLNDIDASDTATWNGGAGFEPIGTPAAPFTGTLDGQGFTIDGLVINRPVSAPIGVFSYVSGTIKNIRFESVDIFCSFGCGVIFQINSTGVVEFFSVEGSVVGVSSSTGLVAATNHGVVRNSHADGDSQSNTICGGLIGYNLGAIDKCYATAVVSGSESGGLVGVNPDTVTDSYYDSETSGQSDTGKGTPKTTAEMKQEATFVGWDFDAVWDIDDGYPFLRTPATPQSGILSKVNSDLTITEIANVNADAIYSMADFGEQVIITNGENTISVIDGVASVAAVTLDAVCGYDARLFYAKNDEPLLFTSMAFGEDIPNILAGTDIVVTDAAKGEDVPIALPFSGPVLGIRRLGDNIIVYGHDGIIAITEPLGIPGLQEIPNFPQGVGLDGAAAVAGDLTKHIFRGTDGNLYALQANLQATRLGYAWVLDAHNIISHDPILDEYWVTDGVDSYLLTPYGFSGPIDQVPLSIAVINGESIATGFPYDETIPILVHTNTFDMAQNGQKRVTVVNLMGEFTDASVGILFKYATGDEWRERPPRRCSPEGAAFIAVALVYGQLKVHATCEPEDRLQRIEVRYQAHDRRFIRGTRGFAGTNEENGDA